jgi:hypothetical protein
MLVNNLILRLAPLIVCMTGNLMAQSPDTTEDIRGPKALVDIPEPEKFPIALWVGVAVSLVIIALALFFLKKHRRKQQLKSPPEIALASLAKLEATRETLAAETFANQAAWTLRQYIADRFGLAAPRRTTEEFFREIEQNGTEPIIAESDHLKAFMKSCDLAKFAGSSLDATQRGELLQTARAFITATAPNLTLGKP